LSSPDGMKWSRHISGTNNGLNDIILVDGSVPNASRKYVVVGSNGTVLTSADGSTWLRKNSTTEVDLASGVYANKHFVIFGNDGHILTSGDGKEWAGEELDSAYLPLPVSHGNGRHVAIGPIGAFLCSTDGIKWRLVSSGTSFKLSKIAFGNNAFVAVGDSGTVMVSSTGDNWTKASSATTNDLFTIAYGNGQFVATGDSGVIITSPNGTSWTRQKSTMSDSLCEITYGAGIFAALGKPAGALLTSTDGCTWSRRILCTSSMPQGVVYGNNEFLIVGENGMMLSSTPGLPPLQPDSPKADNRDRLTNDSCIGLSTDLAFEDPRVILVNAAGHIVRKTAKIENAEQFAYLQTPESFQSIQEFIPPGWVLLDSTAGDLSHDGIDDLALVMQYHDSILIDIGDVWGVVPTQPRILVIAFRDSANGQYKVMEQSNTFILRNEISNMIDPFQNISVQDGALEIAFSFFCTMGGWGATNLSYQFRYQNAEFELIKAHIYYWMRNTGENEDTEYDFEKKRIKRTIGNNSEDEAQAKVKWSDIHLAKLRNLKTFRRPYTWEIKHGYQL
ncbi:MAG TPA: hypothetical protein VHV83_02040, partial [Armatimonadota bacterium]|nr:hypothetical protein [Armatimonadota bacterium]